MASSSGMASMVLKEQEWVVVQEWYCLGTMENLRLNSHVSVVIWDRNVDRGFQLIGETETISDIDAFDGDLPKTSKRFASQSDGQLLILVKKAIDFKRSPHSDIEA